MSRAVFALTLVCAIAGCGNRAKPQEADEPDYREQAEREAYEPDATEVPLSLDFAQAARRRVHSENYREELSRIERELKLATHKQ
jgi:hypothetical protein